MAGIKGPARHRSPLLFYCFVRGPYRQVPQSQPKPQTEQADNSRKAYREGRGRVGW